MQNTHGEYSLPYIDTELEDKSIQHIVDYFIEQEKKQIPPPTDLPQDPANTPIRTKIPKHIPSSKTAHYESLQQERALLEVLLVRRREFWGGEDKKLSTYIDLVEKKQDSIQEEIDEINLDRYRYQKEAEKRLERLKTQISNLESSIESERREIERLGCT